MMNLEEKVVMKIKGHTEVNSEDISVTEKNGIIHLSGYADGENAKATIEAIAESVTGADKVISTVTVKELSSGRQGISIS